PLRPKPDRIDGRRPPGDSAQPGSSVRAALIDPQGSLVRRLGASQIAGRLGRAALGYLGQRVSLKLGDALKTLPSTPAVVLALRRSVGASRFSELPLAHKTSSPITPTAIRRTAKKGQHEHQTPHAEHRCPPGPRDPAQPSHDQATVPTMRPQPTW